MLLLVRLVITNSNNHFGITNDEKVLIKED